MLRQLKQGIQFFYGDGEVLALGWEGEGAVVPEWAKSALRRFQKNIALLKQLLKTQMHTGYDPLLRVFDLTLWCQDDMKPSLRRTFKQLCEASGIPCCEEQFDIVRRYALERWKDILKDNPTLQGAKKRQANSQC